MGWLSYPRELRHDVVLGSSHDNPIDSLSLSSESPAILCLFGARRLSQQSHSFFPEPRKGAYPYIRGHHTGRVRWGTSLKLRIFFAFIHPSAWKEISAKFGCKKKG